MKYDKKKGITPYVKKVRQVHLKGKLTMKLRCGCCDAFNNKPEMLWKEAGKEIRFTDKAQ